MAEEKFAFESAEVSLAMFLSSGLGDALVPRKILNAVIELDPRCSVDIFCTVFARTYIFYSDSPNVNLIRGKEFFGNDFAQKYDLVLRPFGTFAMFVDKFDAERLKAKSPALYEYASKINAFNEKNFKRIMSNYNYDALFLNSMEMAKVLGKNIWGFYDAIALHTMEMARVLGKNMWYFLSSGGALPIRDDATPYISLSKKFEAQFNDLKLGKYITIYSNIGDNENDLNHPKIKTWSMEHLVEYVRLVKEHFPQIKVIQCGTQNIKIDGVDGYMLTSPLELTKHILANSLLHVGCEGGLIHLATALGTKCIVIFSSTSVHVHGYKQNINLVSDLSCNPCSYVWGGGASKTCPRGYKDPPCRLSVTPQQVFEATCNYLDSFDLRKYAADVVDYVSHSQNIDVVSDNAFLAW